MNLTDAIKARRAVKHYDPEFEIPESEVREMLATAMLTPTAFNIQHWRFVWVRDPELRKAIRAQAWDQAQVTDASVLLLMTADTKAWEKNPGRYWPVDDGSGSGAPQQVVDFLLPAIATYYDGKSQVQRDECMRSMGLAGMALMLLAKEYGYDSCPMDGFDFDAVAKLIGLPEDHVIGFMLAIGKKTKDAWPRIGKLSLEETLIIDKF